MNKTKLLRHLRKELKASKPRSAWGKGVLKYALELVGELEEYSRAPESYKELKKFILNGAYDFQQYSDGGCSLISNYDIARRLCSPSELKRTKNGQYEPNSRENWIDVQARALYQAYLLIEDSFMRYIKTHY